MVKAAANQRRASYMAHLSNTQPVQAPGTVDELVQRSHAALSFQLLTLQRELQMLDELKLLASTENESSQHKLLKTLFDLLDHDETGFVALSRLIQGLQNIPSGNPELDSRVQTTVQALKELPSNNDSDEKLDAATFASVMTDTVAPTLNCTVEQLAELLLVKVVFGSSGPDLSSSLSSLQQSSSAPVTTSQTSNGNSSASAEMDPDLRRAMKDRRMKALFKVFDAEDNGTVDFKSFVVGCYKIMENANQASHAAVQALLVFDEQHVRSLSYKDFCRLVLSLVAAASSHTTGAGFDDVLDTMTRNALHASSGITESYVLQQFSLPPQTTQKILLELTAHDGDHDKFVQMGVLELAKLDRLYHLFDVSRTGWINAQDLALGLQKFHHHHAQGALNPTELQATVKETQHVMHEFDAQHHGQLSKSEFASFIVSFATSAGLELLDLLDFMIVVVSLQENTQAEQDYLQALGNPSRDPLNYWYG